MRRPDMSIDMDGYLTVLMVVDDGEHSVSQVAGATGLSERDALERLHRLESSGFLSAPAGRRNGSRAAAGYVVSTLGKQLIRLAFDEIYKRDLAEQLGGLDDHAS